MNDPASDKSATDEPGSTTSELRPHESALLYPTFGHLTSDGQTWQVEASGTIFALREKLLQRKMLTRVLQRMMRVSISPQQNAFFARRVDGFLADAEAGRHICLGIGPDRWPLPQRTQSNGHFRDRLSLNVSRAEDLVRIGQYGERLIDLNLITPDDDPRPFTGTARLIEPQGWSVISDIDDTIKLSDVADRRQLLRNTFLHEFEAVPGMAETYRAWAEQGATFHYVSSSPWQLYGCLAELLEHSGFPPGSIHLRGIRMRDASILRLFLARRAAKLTVISSLLKTFPQRQFVLVGDSGEQDPEIYGEAARRFPRQVKQVLIRRVRGRIASTERLRRAFLELSRDRWQLFTEAAELADSAPPRTTGQPV